ncbi:MAG TPA: methyltransferase domain-containing protein [Terriglobales bacterium]|jgi:ubiquinone/menaquinone biosynthesis C-methylase UbiE|nr:methyltransferase domain-containing protein [Terriglobales bacterium]
MKRVPSHELLDTDAGTPEEISGTLTDLRMFNRWFGGTSCTTRLVDQVARQTSSTSLSWLDVAAGAGYVPHFVRERFAKRNVHLDITLLDRAASHIRNGTRAVVGDALALPFRDATFDFVSSELFVHHLAPDQVVQFAREALRVCRHAFVINDLIRDPVHLALAYAGFPLYQSRITRNDAPASVRQAYTVEEMRAMLRETGARSIEINTCFLYRMGAIVWKK